MNGLAELRSRATHAEGAYHAWPAARWGVELEVGDFLWGLVRALRPALVLESGTGIGISARFLARGCMENGTGQVVTFEPEERWRAETAPKLAGLPVTIEPADTLAWDGPMPDLVFLDSYPKERRLAEMERWLATSVLLAVHDANRYELPECGLHVPTPRGLWLGRGQR